MYNAILFFQMKKNGEMMQDEPVAAIKDMDM
jgi:hypothetical protein